MALDRRNLIANKDYIYRRLSDLGFNKATVCGILANIERESGFDPQATQNPGKDTNSSYTKKLDTSLNDQLLAKDGRGYGINQWTFWTRKLDLIRFARKKNKSIGLLEVQMDFMSAEFRGLAESKDSNFISLYSKLSKISNNAEGAQEAAKIFCEEYENPQDLSGEKTKRASLALNYWNGYSPNTDGSDYTETEDIDTPSIEQGYPGTSAVDYQSLTSIDKYTDASSSHLKSINILTAATQTKYGYLLDIKNNREFIFPLPVEFSEVAGANWKDIDIRGRSVQVKSYESTNSRSISISVDLYAGEGLYEPIKGESGFDAVTRMHKDIKFVESLEYPDYTNAIVQPPPVVHLILGASVNLIGVVQDVKVTHLRPYDFINRAMYIKLQFTVVQSSVNPPDTYDIRGIEVK